MPGGEESSGQDAPDAPPGGCGLMACFSRPRAPVEPDAEPPSTSGPSFGSKAVPLAPLKKSVSELATNKGLKCEVKTGSGGEKYFHMAHEAHGITSKGRTTAVPTMDSLLCDLADEFNKVGLNYEEVFLTAGGKLGDGLLIRTEFQQLLATLEVNMPKKNMEYLCQFLGVLTDFGTLRCTELVFKMNSAMGRRSQIQVMAKSAFLDAMKRGKERKAKEKEMGMSRKDSGNGSRGGAGGLGWSGGGGGGGKGQKIHPMPPDGGGPGGAAAAETPMAVHGGGGSAQGPRSMKVHPLPLDPMGAKSVAQQSASPADSAAGGRWSAHGGTGLEHIDLPELSARSSTDAPVGESTDDSAAGGGGVGAAAAAGGAGEGGGGGGGGSGGGDGIAGRSRSDSADATPRDGAGVGGSRGKRASDEDDEGPHPEDTASSLMLNGEEMRLSLGLSSAVTAEERLVASRMGGYVPPPWSLAAMHARASVSVELGTYGQFKRMSMFGRELHGYVGSIRNPYVKLKHYKDRIRAGGTANFRGGGGRSTDPKKKTRAEKEASKYNMAEMGRGGEMTSAEFDRKPSVADVAMHAHAVASRVRDKGTSSAAAAAVGRAGAVVEGAAGEGGGGGGASTSRSGGGGP